MKHLVRISCVLASVFSLTPLSVTAREPGGIWKYSVPQEIPGEFEKHDPVGLIAGVLIPTDCSMNWLAEDGRIYCFTTGTSYVHFMRMPQTNLRRAVEAWADLKPGTDDKAVERTK